MNTHPLSNWSFLWSKRGSEAGAESQRWGEEVGGTLWDCKSRNNDLGSSKPEVLSTVSEHTVSAAGAQVCFSITVGQYCWLTVYRFIITLILWEKK